MDGYRITESGDLRLSEDGNTRITEQASFAEASLSATGSKIVAAHSIQLVETGLVSSSSSSFVASKTTGANFGGYPENSVRVTEAGDVRVTEDGNTRVTLFAPAEEAAGSITASTLRTRSGLTDLTSIGNSTYLGLASRPTEASLTGSGSLSSDAIKKKIVSKTLGAVASIVSEGSRTKSPALFGGFPEDPVRILENGDTRITEDGDTRIATNVVFNAASGTIQINGSLIKFNSVVYIKQDGVWVQISPYAQYNSNWQQPQKINRYTDGVWKRIN